MHYDNWHLGAQTGSGGFVYVPYMHAAEPTRGITANMHGRGGQRISDPSLRGNLLRLIGAFRKKLRNCLPWQHRTRHLGTLVYYDYYVSSLHFMHVTLPFCSFSTAST
jgi:hypothetical protein